MGSDSDKKIQVELAGDASGGIASLMAFHSAAKETFDGVSSSLGNLGGGINTIIGSMGILGGILAGGAAFKGIISETVNWDLSAGKLAKTLGDTTEHASILKVQLQHLGIDQDLVSSAAMKMAKTMNTNSDAFKAFGVDAVGMNKAGKTTTEIMMATIDALKKYKGGMDINQAAMTIFGRSWKDMQPLLRLTAQGFKDAEVRARELHLIVGPEGVARAREYEESLNDLKLVGTSLSHSVGTELVHALVEMGTMMEGPATKAAKIFAGAIHEIHDNIRLTIKAQTDWEKSLTSVMNQHSINALTLIMAAKAAMTGDYSLIPKILSAGYQAGKSMKGESDLPKTDGSSASGETFDAKAAAEAAAQAAAAEALFKSYLAAREGLNKQLRGANPDLTEMQRKFLDVDDTVSKLTRDMPQYVASWQDFGVKMKGNLTITEKLKIATAAYKEEAKETEEVLKGMGSLQVFGQGLGGILGQKKDKKQSQFSLDGSRAPKKNFGADLSGPMPADQQSQSDKEREEDMKRTAQFEEMVAQIQGDSLEKQRVRAKQEEDVWLNTWAKQGNGFAANEARKAAVQEAFAQKRSQIERREQEQKLDWIKSGFSSAASLADSFYSLSKGKSKAAFDVAKAMKVGETIMSTGSAAMKAYDAMADIPMVGPELGALAAAAAIAAGMVQIKNIESASSSGGGGSMSSSGGGSPGGSGSQYGGPSSSFVQQPKGGQNRQGGSITVQVMGNIIGEQSWVDNNLIPSLNDALGRNVSLNIGAVK